MRATTAQRAGVLCRARRRAAAPCAALRARRRSYRPLLLCNALSVRHRVCCDPCSAHLSAAGCVGHSHRPALAIAEQWPAHVVPCSVAPRAEPAHVTELQAAAAVTAFDAAHERTNLPRLSAALHRAQV